MVVLHLLFAIPPALLLWTQNTQTHICQCTFVWDIWCAHNKRIRFLYPPVIAFVTIVVDLSNIE